MWNWTNWNRFREQVTEWIANLEARRIADELRINTLEIGNAKMSAELDALKAEFTSYKADVDSQVGTLLGAVKKLTDQIAAGRSDTAAITALTEEVKAARTALDATVNPPAPTPVPAA